MRFCSLWPAEAFPRALFAAALLAGLALLVPERAAAENCGVQLSSPSPLRLDACLTPNQPGDGLFGTAVAVSPDQGYVVVGAPKGKGAAYVFVLDSGGNVSSEPVRLQTPTDLPTDAAFGQSVAISEGGLVVAVGAPRAAVRGTSSGAVYLFQLKEGSWAQMGSPIVGGDTNAFDLFGFAVALTDNGTRMTLLVGAPLHDAPNGLANSGAAYVFDREGDVWSQRQKLTAGDADLDDQLGFSVSVNGAGSVFLIGAPQARPVTPNRTNLGKVYLFEAGADRSLPIAEGPATAQISQDLLAFGFSVSLRGDGNAALVGAPGAFEKRGAAYLLTRSESWGLNRDLHDLFVDIPSSASPSVAGDELGFSVSIDDPSVVVGARRTKCGNDFFGSAFFFQVVQPPLPDPPAVDVHFLGKICNTVEGTEVGTAVAVRGATFLVGIPPMADRADDLQGSAQVLSVTSDLSIELERLAGTVVPGREADYKLTVRNGGSAKVVGAKVILSFSQQVKSLTGFGGYKEVPCTENAVSCFKTTVDLGAMGTRVFNLGVTINPAERGTLVTNAEVKVPETVRDPDPDNNEPQTPDSIDLDPKVSLSFSLRVAEPVVPGTIATYTVTITNGGPSTATNVTLSDSFQPPGFVTAITRSCSAQGGRCETPTKVTVIPPHSGKAIFTIAARIRPDATMELSYLLIIRSAEAQPLSGMLQKTLQPQAELMLDFTDFPRSAVPGNPLPVTYQLKVSSGGPSNSPGSQVVFLVPLEISAVTWTCESQGNASCRAGQDLPSLGGRGSIDERVDLRRQGTLVYTIRGLVPADVVRRFDSKACIKPGPGVMDLNQINGQNCTSVTTTVQPTADLSVVVADLSGVVPGNPLPQTFTVTVSNSGPSDARQARVRSVFSPNLGAVDWTCAALNGSCTPSGRGNLNDRVSLRAGGKLTYTVRFVVGAGAVGPLVNKASVATGDPDPGEAQLTDPRSANNDDEGQITLKPITDLAIARHEGPEAVVPGNPLPAIYTFEVTNAGPSDARGARVTHSFSPGMATVSWTCAATNASCGSLQGNGDVADTASLRVGGRLVYTIKAIAGPELTGMLRASANVTARPWNSDPRGANNTLAADEVPLTPVADLRVRFAGPATAVPGSLLPVTATLAVTNAGPSDVRTATVTTILDPGVTSATWTCAAVNGSCSIGGTGNINDSASLRVGGTVTYTLRFLVAPDAFSKLTNRASAMLPLHKLDTDIIDPVQSNNTNIETTTILTPVADLAISADTLDPSVTYTIHVTNAGPSDALNATVTGTSTSSSWTCSALRGSCAPSGSGQLMDQISLRAGGSLIYKVTDAANQSACVTAPVGGTDPRTGNNCGEVPPPP